MIIRYIPLIALLLPLAGRAAQPVDDFDAFITGSMKDFDSFITEANREYLDFMRNPWKKYQGKEPAVKRVTPEPKEAPVFNPQSSQSQEPPRQLTIREILDLTTAEGKQGKTIEATPILNTPTTSPATTPTTPTTPATTPTTSSTPEATTTPTVTPTVTPTRRPVTTVIRDTVKAKPTGTPKPTTPAVSSGTDTPTTKTPTKKTPTKKTVNDNRTSPLYVGGDGRRRINFYGIDYFVNDGLANAITMSGVNEKVITSALESLYSSNYTPLLTDLRNLRANDLGNDWALYLIVKQIAESFVGRDESVVMRQFLLNMLGMRARVARVAETNRLTLMIAPSVPLYGCLYITEGGTRFYDVEATKPFTFYMCSKEAPDAKKKIDMSMAGMPRMAQNRKAATRTAPRYATSVSTSVPLQRMEFYSHIPQCDYSVYATAQVDPEFSSPLLLSLRKAIEGKDEKTAANILLDFCQNGFEYATDPEQFGYEKPFFVEELFHYPKCDCEDRSMLYRYLVKSLLNLDVVLVDYPNHIATAVKFNGDYTGDHIVVNGQRYLICDPTYMGASAGMAMPQFKSVAANVLRY